MIEWWRRRQAEKLRRIEESRLERKRLAAQWEEERRERNAKEQVELRERFRTSLVGRWHPLVGSASFLENQAWTVLPDGTGSVETYRVFGQPESIEHFEWKQLGDWSLAIRTVRIEYVDSEGSDEPDDEEEDAPDEWDWVELRYDFLPVPTEGGSINGLCSFRLKTGEPHTTFASGEQTFFMSLAPLSFVGPIK